MRVEEPERDIRWDAEPLRQMLHLLPRVHRQQEQAAATAS
jgi:hypothetical protein